MVFSPEENEQHLGALLEEVEDIAKQGLGVDGGHHKQWYLEQILETIGVNVKKLRENAGNTYLGEEGIPP